MFNEEQIARIKAVAFDIIAELFPTRSTQMEEAEKISKCCWSLRKNQTVLEDGTNCQEYLEWVIRTWKLDAEKGNKVARRFYPQLKRAAEYEPLEEDLPAFDI